MTAQATLSGLAKEHGTPLFVVDHDILRENYRRFRRLLPDVQAYYAVKANPDPAIVKTLYEGGSFDVASLPEFLHRSREHQVAAGPRAAGLHLGQDHLRQPDQGQRDARRAGPLRAAGDLRQPGGDRQDSAAAPHAGLVFASRCPTPARWSICRRSSARRMARRSI